MAKSTETKGAELVVNNQFIDALVVQLQEKEKYGVTFPKDYNYQNALMGAYLMMKETKDKNGKNILESCSQASIANSLMDLVTLGLNVQKKQGYFIAYGGTCQFQQSYFGKIASARRYGLKEINADVIYEGDTFIYHKEDGRTVIDKHEQDFMNIDNDKIIGSYAVAIMKDGSKLCEIMNIKQLKQSWNQKQGGYKEVEYDTHVKFREEMAKKTVSNRLTKHIVNTFGDPNAIESFNSVEYAENIDTVSIDAEYEVQQNANTEDFEEEVIEVVEGEVMEEQEEEPDFA